jgi:PAS domain S-box-containing protein
MNIRAFLTPPVFEDQEQTRVARLLHIVLGMITLAVTVAFPVCALILPGHLFRWLGLLFFFDIAHPLLMMLNHRGATRWAGIAILFELWIVITVLAATAGGIHAPGTTGYLVTVFVAGLLFNEKTGIWVGVLCALSGLGFVFLETTGHLPTPSIRHTPWSLWVTQVLFITVTITLQFLATRLIRNALRQTQQELEERRRSEVALRRSEERYRSLVTATAQVVWSTNPEGKVIDDISSWREFTGQRAEDTLGHGWLNAIHPEDRECTARIWSRAVASRSIYQTEYRLHRADGQWRDMTVRGVPIFEKDGTIREWIGFNYDITEPKQAGEEIRKLNEMLARIASVTANTLGEEYFRTLVRHLAESLGSRYAFIGQLTDNTKVQSLAVWKGDGFGDNFEYSLDKTPCANVIGQSICVYRQAVQKTFPEDFLLAQMGVESYCGIPISGSNGRALGILVVLDDKPMAEPDPRLRTLLEIFASRAGMELERLRIDKALRKSEEKFSKAFQCSPVIFTMSTLKEMRYIAVNETFTRTTGYSAEEVIGRTPKEINILAQPEKLNVFTDLLLARGQVRNYEFDIRARNGEERTVLISAEVIDIAGELCVLSVSEDITERKKAETILRRSHQELEMLVKQRTGELETSNKELKAFSYTVSHDLQSPLRAIIGFARAIQEDYGERLDEEGVEFLRRIVQSSERMTRLIENLLSNSRIGRGAVALVPVALNDVIKEVASEFDLPVRAIGGEIIMGDLPIVRGERTLLTQTFTNLFQNAVNYRRKDTPLKLSISFRLDNGDAAICVTDNGVGIAREYHQKIFEAFQRLHSEKEIPGTGLGLANVKKSVEALGGKVWVESEPGKGSTFCLKLQPLATGFEM